MINKRFNLARRRMDDPDSPELSCPADEPFQILSFRMAQINGMVNRMRHPTDELDLPARIDGSRKDNFLEEVPIHMVGAGKGEEESFRSQQAEGLKIEILISPRGPGKSALLFGKRRRIKNNDIIFGLEASHHLKGVPPDRIDGEALPRRFSWKCPSAISKAS